MWHLDELHGAPRHLRPGAGALPGVPVEAGLALPQHGRGAHTLVVAAAVLGRAVNEHLRSFAVPGVGLLVLYLRIY